MELILLSESTAPKAMVDDEDVFFIVSSKALFVYVGGKCSKDEKRNALSRAHVSMPSLLSSCPSLLLLPLLLVSNWAPGAVKHSRHGRTSCPAIGTRTAEFDDPLADGRAVHEPWKHQSPFQMAPAPRQTERVSAWARVCDKPNLLLTTSTSSVQFGSDVLPSLLRLVRQSCVELELHTFGLMWACLASGKYGRAKWANKSGMKQT
ncbi:unnamed protein product [Protopolystoma xenopodis]|uniref:Gelsolin-like domain-containing protein n=1 Tax=Protopolystoma xenopodis TaxID=117903 RepID=A0A3S5AFQ2_9PLAT|nr:unnamed protein product [Protopolystoma xenopodis]